MAHYIEYSTEIYKVYMKYVAPEDMLVYSIDEVFMDVSKYLGPLKLSPKDFAMKIIMDVLETTGITATAGIGPISFCARWLWTSLQNACPLTKTALELPSSAK